MNKFSSSLSNSNANSTCEFTSNTLRIITSKQKPSKIFPKINNFNPTSKSSFKHTNELNDSLEFDKEIVQNTSGIFDNSLVKNIETMESIFQLKTTERDLLGKENLSIVQDIQEEKKKTEEKKKEENNKKDKKTYKKTILFIGLVILLVTLSFLCGFGVKYLFK